MVPPSSNQTETIVSIPLSADQQIMFRRVLEEILAPNPVIGDAHFRIFKAADDSLFVSISAPNLSAPGNTFELIRFGSGPDQFRC